MRNYGCGASGGWLWLQPFLEPVFRLVLADKDQPDPAFELDSIDRPKSCRSAQDDATTKAGLPDGCAYEWIFVRIKTFDLRQWQQLFWAERRWCWRTRQNAFLCSLFRASAQNPILRTEPGS